MIRRGLLSVVFAAFGLIVMGCGGSPEGGSGVVLAEAGGVVKMKGAPISGATVNFLPEKGPLATGTTDLEGKFKLSSGATHGAAIGKCKVTVTLVEAGSGVAAPPKMDTSRPPANEEEAKQRMQSAEFMKNVQTSGKPGASGGKSIINPKFADPDQSGLTATVDKDPSKNQFTFEVTE
jgi:hypothetical protein